MLNCFKTAESRFSLSFVYVFQSVVTLVRIFPDCLSDCIFAFVRLLFLSLLGCAAFIRKFNNGECTYFSLTVAFVVWYIYKRRLAEKEKLKVAECMETQNSCLEDELNQQRGLYSTLEYVKSALASKSEIEKLAEAERCSLQQEIDALKKQNKDYCKKMNDLRTCNRNLNEDLAAKKTEASKLRQDFKTKLDKFECAVKQVKELERECDRLKCQLTDVKRHYHEKEQSTKSLKSAVEALTCQRAQVLEKYSAAIKQVGCLKNENRELSKAVNCQRSLRKQDTDKIGEIEQLTQRLQTSLSNAKGRLSRVGGRLADSRGPSRGPSSRPYSPKPKCEPCSPRSVQHY